MLKYKKIGGKTMIKRILSVISTIGIIAINIIGPPENVYAYNEISENVMENIILNRK